MPRIGGLLSIVILCSFACAQAGAETAAAQTSELKFIHPNCLNGTEATTKTVTHYYVPLLDTYDHFTCDTMEGTCIYKKGGVEWLHNYGYTDQKLTEARCKNGYGNRSNCLNPCRTIAASTAHHKFGEIIFIKALVGKKCGMARDKTEMIHDGFVMVGDTGSSSIFNIPGRFDFFWGRCQKKSNGVCLEGAQNLSDSATTEAYCKIWSPQTPNMNANLRDAFLAKMRQEAIARGDFGAAEEF